MKNPKPYWKQDLDEANAKFEKFGIKVKICEQDGFYRSIVEYGDENDYEVFADNYYESELDELVHDTIGYVNGKIKQLDGLKLFIVTYVGLSDDEDANGYCEPKPFFSRKKAEDYMRMLRDNELEEQKDYNPIVIEDTPERIVIQWCGYQQLIIRLHEEEIG